MNRISVALSSLAAWLSNCWQGRAFLLLQAQQQHERQQWAKQEQYYKDRIAALEQQVRQEQDRILAIKAVPLNPHQRSQPPQPRVFGPTAAIQAARQQHETQLAQKVAAFAQAAEQFKNGNSHQPTEEPNE